jgi:hypothetical protein
MLHGSEHSLKEFQFSSPHQNLNPANLLKILFQIALGFTGGGRLISRQRTFMGPNPYLISWSFHASATQQVI